MEQQSLGSLAVWRHVPHGAPSARVLHIHGISEHSGRHLPTVLALNAAGVEVVRFDLRGSGMSGGRRQYVARFDDYVEDTARVFNWIGSDLPRLPLFVMGHSLGGAIALHFSAQYGPFFEGLILSAPAFKVGSVVSPLTIAVGRVVSKFLPTLKLRNGEPSHLSRNPLVIEAYKNDPLASHFNTLRQGEVVLNAFKNLPEACRKIKNPVLITHGTSDRLIKPEGSFELLRALGSKHKELHYLPGVFHEPHLDLESEKFFAIVTRWLAHQKVKR